MSVRIEPIGNAEHEPGTLHVQPTMPAIEEFHVA
jgi:hypothetical protein